MVLSLPHRAASGHRLGAGGRVPRFLSAVHPKLGSIDLILPAAQGDITLLAPILTVRDRNFSDFFLYSLFEVDGPDRLFEKTDPLLNRIGCLLFASAFAYAEVAL